MPYLFNKTDFLVYNNKMDLHSEIIPELRL